MNTKVQLALLIACIFSQTAIWSQERVIQVTSERNEDKSMSFSCAKNEFGTYYLELWFTDLENAYSSGYKGNIDVANRDFLQVKPINNNRPINCTYRTWYIRGELDPKFDPAFSYLLPLSCGKPVKVRFMSYLNSKYFGAESPKNWHAYQFVANPGDTVYSARKGTVVKIEDDNEYKTDFTVLYQSTINKITIEHPDGTLAEYSGFKGNEIWVKEGETVYPHSPLGVLAQYDKETAQLRFKIFYLDEIPVSKNRQDKLNDKFQYYSYVEPHFLTESGMQSLENGESYTGLVNEEIILKEFSKKELRQLKKGEINLPDSE
ncbi:M23 family metallopeptidase [Draconibacterium sp. IB214405]|uniref:M23 family metallopeptidase n=1 Tax=Draconibacterium sp. IB214405 TaxID=3097352 RepID=UPI002A16F7C4|nr:M23 family metallopeptidase [Draconibacterium sp. IB214405]MDX8339188.1 M23 family metallopeptidase [Draconibacterium sp. IB214405]